MCVGGRSVTTIGEGVPYSLAFSQAHSQKSGKLELKETRERYFDVAHEVGWVSAIKEQGVAT